MNPAHAGVESDAAIQPEAARTYALRAGAACVAVVPAHGCLIHAIDPGAGNILWRTGARPRTLTPSAVVGAESAREFDDSILVGGWFPMFPSAGVPTPTTQQHGWAPRVAWTVVQHAETGLVCVAEGPFLDGGVAELTRSILLDADALTVSTTVRNAGSGDRSFTWGEHPCFSRDHFAGGSTLFDGSQIATVPARANGTAGHIARSAPGATVSVDGPHGTVTLTDGDGTLAHWLYWYNYAAAELARADTFAWEPSTAAGMGVGDAIAADAVETLSPGDTFRATLRCEWTLSTMSPTRVR